MAKKDSETERIRRKRESITAKTYDAILVESGFRCAVPTCRVPDPVEVHHILAVEDGGTNDHANLIALCSSCHDRHHRYDSPTKEALLVYKRTIRRLMGALDRDSIDFLLLVDKLRAEKRLPTLHITGDTVVRNSGLISAGYLDFYPVELGPNVARGSYNAYYQVKLTAEGTDFVDDWKSGRTTRPPERPGTE